MPTGPKARASASRPTRRSSSEVSVSVLMLLSSPATILAGSPPAGKVALRDELPDAVAGHQWSETRLRRRFQRRTGAGHQGRESPTPPVAGRALLPMLQSGRFVQPQSSSTPRAAYAPRQVFARFRNARPRFRSTASDRIRYELRSTAQLQLRDVFCPALDRRMGDSGSKRQDKFYHRDEPFTLILCGLPLLNPPSSSPAGG